MMISMHLRQIHAVYRRHIIEASSTDNNVARKQRLACAGAACSAWTKRCTAIDPSTRATPPAPPVHQMHATKLTLLNANYLITQGF